MALLLALLLAQPATLNLNQTPIESRQDGARLSRFRQYAVDCRTNMTCVVDGGVLLLSSSGGSGGSGAPVDAGYVIWSAAATTGSTNERVLTAGTNVTISTATPGQVIINASGGGVASDFDGGYNVVEDEGSPLTKRTTVNFTGAGVSCIDSGGKTVCTISGGGGGSVNTASGSASFDGGAKDALTTVTAAWASGASVIVCRPTGEESSVEGAQTTVLTQASGSFVVRTEPRNGSHYGALPFVCIGN